MENLANLNKDLQELAKLKNKLNDLDYSNEKYDEVEESLHDLEDDFVEKYGEYLDEVLHNIHDEHCPDNDVLLPIAYLAKEYIISDDNKYTVKSNAGVFVDADEFAEGVGRLVMIPNPTRYEIILGKDKREVLWTLGQDD